MANIDEAFAALSDVQSVSVNENVDFVVDSYLRVISIPVRGVVLGVEGDKDVNRVTFRMSRTYKGVDMSQFQIRINYANANNELNYFKVTEITVSDDEIVFVWVVGADAVAYVGNVEFVVRFIKLSGSNIIQELNTTLATAKSLIGLSVDGEISPVQREDLLAHFYSEIDAYSETKKNEILDSIPEDYTALANEVDELKQEIADKATLENGIIKFWKASTEESRTDTLLYSVDISSIGGTGGLDLENLTLSVSQVGNYQRLSMSDGTTTKNVDIPITTITDEQVQNALNNYMEANPIEETDPTVPDWAKQPTKPKYTASEVGAIPDTTKIPSKTSDLQNDRGFLTEHQDLSGYATKGEIPKTASDVGADASGTAENKVSAHNTATDVHNDIRLLVQGLTDRLNALADSDDETLDQMSEVVAYIKSNKSLIDAITTGKVSVSDIVDNLTTNVSNKPLSAAQGVKLKALIDAITSVELDESLSDNTKAAPAGMVGELKSDKINTSDIIDNLTTDDNSKVLSAAQGVTLKSLVDKKVELPKDNGGNILNGTSGQILQSNGDGTTRWVDKPTTTGTGGIAEETDPTVPEWAKQPTKPTYTAHEVGALPDTTKIPSKTSDLQNDSGFLTQHQDLSGYALKSEIPNVASDIGAESEGTAESKVSAHNVSDTAHNDIRLLVQGLTERLNALADSDDETLDQISEIVSYIKYNRSLINGIDTNKVDVSDIVNSLISNNTDKPLSAKQGRVLKSLIDAIIVPTKLSELENDSGYAKTTDIPDKLPNPQKLTFAGAVTAEYDGSGAVTVTIPESSGGSGVSDEKIAEAVGTYMETHPIEETDPTVPEWAKQQEKPSYTAEEVEALPNTTTTLPNPYPLTFTGGASGSYDGSEALTINIPSGGDGSTYYVTPEQFGAVGDGTTDDTEAFRQAIETELPIICTAGKDYYFANEIVTSKTRINIDGNYSHFTAFRLKINLNEDETNWKTSYPHPDSVIQNVYFMNKNNMDYCIKTGIPIKFVNIDVYYYDLWLKNYGDYMDYMVFDNLAINSRPSNEHYCIELSYLGDNHVFRECRFGAYDANINYVQVSGCKAVNFIDCIINGNVIAYQSVVNLNGCHLENEGQIIIGDTKLNSVINFNGCFFFDQYTVTHGKNVFYNGCEFLVNYRTYGGQNDYMSLNTRDCIILCGTESASSDSNVIIDELRKNEYPNVVYSGNKVVFTPVVLKHTAKTWGLSAGTYTYKFFQSCNPYSIDYGDPTYSTGEESVTVDADTSAVRFRSDYDTYPEMFIHAYRTAPDGSIKKVVIPINGQYIYDYGETLNGILWKEVESIPTPKSTTAVYHNGIYYSGKNYTNARNCICVDKANGVIVRIDENGSSTIISGSGSGGLTESQVNNLIDAKLTGVETLLGGGF